MRNPIVRASLLALALVAGGTSSARGAGPPPVTIRIATLGQDANAGPFFAKDTGIFAKYGITADITIIRKGGGAAIAGAVAGGAADVGEGDISSLAAAHEQGVPLALIFPSSLFKQTAPTTEIMVAKNSPATGAKDLEGKTVALISLQGPSRIATNAWIEAGGAALDKVQFVELPVVDMPAALERGTIAAAVISEPALTIAANGCCRVLGNNFASIGKQWALTGYYATNDWVAKNPDAAKRFVAAMRETAIWANQPRNHAASGAILDTYTPFAPELLAKMTRATFAERLSLPEIQIVLDNAYRYKALKAPLAAKDLVNAAALPPDR